MKKVMAILLATVAAGSALAQPSVGVAVGINPPGVYGRVNMGPLPGAALVLPEPVVIAAPAVVLPRPPIYLYVPTVYQRDWRHNCWRYGACAQPVYFVRDGWVRERYIHDHPGWDRGHREGGHRHDERGHGREHRG
jgi:hypothetical protein